MSAMITSLTEKYRVLGKKGEGTFSEVLKCQNLRDNTFWACKKMKQKYESEEQVNNLREIQAMRRLSAHGNILQLYEVIFDKKTGSLVLICELMDMNIYELIRDKRCYLPDSTVKNYMYQLMKSVEFMHRNGIFHRDVKPENILIKDDLLKLADFGSCRSMHSKQPYTEYISTRWYRAPECLLTDGYYGYQMDMWSVGCVFFEIISLHPLFPGSNEVDQISKIHDVLGTPDISVLAKLRNKSRGMSFNFPPKKGAGLERLLPHAAQPAIGLMYLLCTYDPSERISAKHALRHIYFKEQRANDRKNQALAALQQISDAKPAPPETDPPTQPAPRINLGSQVSTEIVPLNFHKGQLLPFRDRRRRRYKRFDSHNFGTGLALPRLPVNASGLKPSFYESSYNVGLKRTGAALSLLPNLAGSYRNKRAPQAASKNALSHYQLPSLDKRGAGY